MLKLLNKKIFLLRIVLQLIQLIIFKFKLRTSRCNILVQVGSADKKVKVNVN